MDRERTAGADGASPSSDAANGGASSCRNASDRLEGHAPSCPDGAKSESGAGAPIERGRVPWQNRILPVLVFVLLSAAFFAPYLAPGRVLSPIDPKTIFPWSVAATHTPGTSARSNELMSDALLLSVPWWAWNAEQLRDGRLPLWNPFIFCGYPHLALIQSNALYPLSLPFNLLSPVRGIGMSLALHVALAGVLMFAFLRRTGLGRDAAIVGGSAFALNGFFLVRFGAPSYVYTGTWLPLWLWGAEELATPGCARRGAIAIAVAACLGILGAHPQVWTLSAGVALVLMLARVLAGDRHAARAMGRERVRSAARATIAFALATAAGLGLAGIQLVPFAELVQHSLRAPVALESAQRASLPVVGLVQALVPDVFGHPVAGTYWLDDVASRLVAHPEARSVWGLNYCGENLYTGLVTLLLAAVALARPRDARTVCVALLAVAALAVLLGTPLLTLFYWLVPGFRFSRPDRVVFVYFAALSVLAAHGYARLAGDVEHENAPRAGRALVVLGAVLLAVSALAPIALDERIRRGSAEALRRIGRVLATDLTLPGAALVECGVGVLVLTLVALGPLRPRLRKLALPATLVALIVPAARFGWAFNPAQRMPLVPATHLGELLASSERIARIQTRPPLLYPANTPQLAHVFDVHGSSAAALDRFGRLVEAAERDVVVGDKYFLAFHQWSDRTRRLLDLLGVGHVLADTELPLEAEWSGGGVHVYRNAAPLPRFYWAERVEAYAPEADGLERLFDPAFDFRRVALVPADIARALPSTSEPLGDQARVEITSYQAERIVLAVTTPRAALLASSEVDYPGWHARIGGERTPVVTVNTAFRGVVVPAGAHQVTLAYEPASLRWGAALSAVTAISATLGLTLTRRRRGASS